MHELLASVYREFEIVIWSQTAWNWLEAKITELGMLTHPAYRIHFVLDRTSMFRVTSSKLKRDSKPVVHHVKPLALVWSKFPQWDASNTIHIDDLSRNFAMNPQSGLKISAWKKGPQNQGDIELILLKEYLEKIKDMDFRTLDHSKWKSFGK